MHKQSKIKSQLIRLVKYKLKDISCPAIKDTTMKNEGKTLINEMKFLCCSLLGVFFHVKRIFLILRIVIICKKVLVFMTRCHLFSESFVSLFTPDIYQYNFVPEICMSTKTFLTFMVKAKSDVHVALSATYGELHKRTVEVLIGGEGNTRSMIKDGIEGSVRAEALTANVLSGTVYMHIA